MNYVLTEINIYPVKSLAGISLNEAEVTDRGLKFDRRWMLVDENGKFLTQRVLPQMSLIKTKIENGFLHFSHKLKSKLKFSIALETSEYKIEEVIIWDDSVKAAHVSDVADQWFSEALDMKCRLVYMPEESNRFVNNKYATKNEIVSFADAFPFLLIGEESLNDLNSRLHEKLPMNRFRPNFVFSGGISFDEDKMKSFMLNDVVFFPMKPCARCVITTVDQRSGLKGKEPLVTLASFRAQNNNIMFGQNLLHEGKGIIKTGSRLEKIEWK